MKPTIATTSSVKTIDHVATGLRARCYRESKRVTLREVCVLLNSPHGRTMSKQNLSNYEGGKQQWTADFFKAYINAVNDAAATFTKNNH